MSKKTETHEADEIEETERPKRKYTPRLKAPESELTDDERRQHARPVMTAGVAHAERVKLGKMTLAEAARALHKHREQVVRMVAAGRLERDDDGLFDADEIQDMAEELAIQRADPAIDYLKRGYELELNHKEMGFTILFAQYKNLFTMFERVIDRQSTQVERMTQTLYQMSAEKREQLLEDTSAKIEVMEAERQSKNQEEFLGIAKEAFAKFTGGSDAKEAFQTMREVFEDLGEEGLAQILPAMKPSTMGKLQKLMALAEKVEA